MIYLMWCSNIYSCPIHLGCGFGVIVFWILNDCIDTCFVDTKVHLAECLLFNCYGYVQKLSSLTSFSRWMGACGRLFLLKMIWLALCFLQLFILLSCSIAVGTNLSQFICIGRFSAVSFQVLGHMKTILVLILGFILFGKEGLNLHVVIGMIIAVIGMIWYGNASSKPGGKERRSLSMNGNKPQKHDVLPESTEVDEKV